MLERKNRLAKMRDFLDMSRKGRSVFGPFMTMRVRQIREDEPKIGFVTPVKAFKKAVDRNRVKRRMRHLVRELYSEVPRKIHLVILLKPPVKEVGHEELERETRRMLKKIPEALTKKSTPSPREKKRRAKKKKTPRT
jgi:ribonuclease P protein component